MILSQNLRKGTVFLNYNSPWLVLDYSHMKKARGSATIRVKGKNLLNGVIKELTFSSSEKFEEADVKNINMQFLYEQDNEIYFMDTESFEQKSFNSEPVNDKKALLVEGENYQLQIFNNQLVNIIFNKSMEFEVEYTEPGFKGDTSGTTLKPAKLKNGITINVPLFINIGDIVKINTDDLTYTERVKKS